MAVPLESFKNIKMISADAYEVGEITDVRYDPFEWNVAGLKVKVKRSSAKIAAGHSRSTVLILPEKFILCDVLLLSQPIERIKEDIRPDNDNISSLTSLESAKVVTRDNVLVGNVTAIMIDTENWKVPSIAVRLDKGAIEAMNMKKGFFSKINAEIGTDAILSSLDGMIHLTEHMDGLRNSMKILE